MTSTPNTTPGLSAQIAEQTVRILCVRALMADGDSETEATEKVRRYFKALRPSFTQSERGPIVADLGDVDLSKLDLRPGQIIEVTNEDAERYRWFRDECGYERQMDILEASEGVADMLDHHIDKGRCGL
jgi:hypothetical protein